MARSILLSLSLISTVLFDSYRPELHYMRGPGPKWRAKHGVKAEGLAAFG
jgi:hypothetical protein